MMTKMQIEESATDITKAAIEAGLDVAVAAKIKAYILSDKEVWTAMQLAELLQIAKMRRPSVLIWCFADWEKSEEGFQFWHKTALQLEKLEEELADS